jgi:hypothetical protein
MSEKDNGGKKTFEERLKAIAQTVELLGRMQMATEKRIQAIVGIAEATRASIQSLQRIAEAHYRISGLEGAV